MSSRFHLAFLVLSLSALLLSIPGVMGEEEGTFDVNIERYIEFRMDFDHGDKLHIEAEITSSPYPVSIFLMKGEDAYEDWTESEDVDIQAILEGENVSDMNVAFEVIENFSLQNTTDFQEKINIGEKDTYFFIIALHRDSSMDTQEVLSRASQVQYRVDWRIEEKDVPYELLALAAVFFLAGIGFFVAYIISRRRYLATMDTQEEEAGQRVARGPVPPQASRERRRAPPMR